MAGRSERLKDLLSEGASHQPIAGLLHAQRHSAAAGQAQQQVQVEVIELEDFRPVNEAKSSLLPLASSSPNDSAVRR